MLPRYGVLIGTYDHSGAHQGQKKNYSNESRHSSRQSQTHQQIHDRGQDKRQQHRYHHGREHELAPVAQPEYGGDTYCAQRPVRPAVAGPQQRGLTQLGFKNFDLVPGHVVTV